MWREAQRAFAQEPFFEKPPHLALLRTVMPVFACPADGRVWQPKDFGPFQVAFTSYLGVEGTDRSRKDGLLFVDSRIRLAQVIDGTSNTLMVGERPPSADLVFGWWYAGWGQAKDGSAEMVLGVSELNVSPRYQHCPPGPYTYQAGSLSNNCDLFHFWSVHSGGAHFQLADGSVHFLDYSAAPLMPALATRAGREVVTLRK